MNCPGPWCVCALQPLSHLRFSSNLRHPLLLICPNPHDVSASVSVHLRICDCLSKFFCFCPLTSPPTFFPLTPPVLFRALRKDTYNPHYIVAFQSRLDHPNPFSPSQVLPFGFLPFSGFFTFHTIARPSLNFYSTPSQTHSLIRLPFTFPYTPPELRTFHSLSRYCAFGLADFCTFPPLLPLTP